MNDVVRHALTARAYALHSRNKSDANPQRPNVFGGTVWLVDEIKQATGKAFEAALALGTARAIEKLDGMVAAQADLKTQLEQLTRMNESIGQVLAWHVDYQKREAGNAG